MPRRPGYRGQPTDGRVDSEESRRRPARPRATPACSTGVETAERLPDARRPFAAARRALPGAGDAPTRDDHGREHAVPARHDRSANGRDRARGRGSGSRSGTRRSAGSERRPCRRGGRAGAARRPRSASSAVTQYSTPSTSSEREAVAGDARVPVFAPATVPLVHHTKSLIVAGPCPARYRTRNSPSASSVLESARVRHPLVEQHERLLGPVRRAPAQHAGLRQIVDEVVAALAGGARCRSPPRAPSARRARCCGPR